jgi:hypothetical protein
MTIGPEPMIRIFLMSFRRGTSNINSFKSCVRPFDLTGCDFQPTFPAEQPGFQSPPRAQTGRK